MVVAGSKPKPGAFGGVITYRLPRARHVACNAAAAKAGLSLQKWVDRAVRAALVAEAGPPSKM